MKFKTDKDAMNYAGNKYKKDNKMVLLAYSEDVKKMFGEWAKSKDINNQIVSTDGERFYYYDKGVSLFPTEKDRNYISLEQFEKFWNKQFLNYKIKEAKKDSDSYVFYEHITKEALENRDSIFNQISKLIF